MLNNLMSRRLGWFSPQPRAHYQPLTLWRRKVRGSVAAQRNHWEASLPQLASILSRANFRSGPCIQFNRMERWYCIHEALWGSFLPHSVQLLRTCFRILWVFFAITVEDSGICITCTPLEVTRMINTKYKHCHRYKLCTTLQPKP